MPRRVSSPSAAKTGAAPRKAAEELARRDMALDVADLRAPTAVVHAEGLGAARGRQLVEAGLHHGQARALRGGLEAELDQRHRLGRVIDLGVDRVRMPALREQAFG